MIIAEFKTMLTLDKPASIIEEEIDGRRCKMSKREFSNRTLEAGLLLSDQEKILVMTSVAPSGARSPATSPRAATAVTAVEVVADTPASTTKKEVEVMI